MPKYHISFTINGEVTPESERVLNALAGKFSREDEFDQDMTPAEAGLFIDAACQAIGICPLPGRTGGES